MCPVPATMPGLRHVPAVVEPPPPTANRKRVLQRGLDHEVWVSPGVARPYYWCTGCGVIAGGSNGRGLSFAP